MAATVTAEALREHGRREDLWIAVHGHVYDVTAFLEEVPRQRGRTPHVA